MKIAENCVVAIDYTLTDDDQNTLDSSSGGEPLQYLHGSQGIIPGLENALVGKSAGDELKVTVQPEDGYGPVVPELIQMAPVSAFEGIAEIKPGMQFQAKGPEGQVQIITVKAVTDEGIAIDANHPLAGQVLHFDVKIKEVRAATDEEIAHGHAH